MEQKFYICAHCGNIITKIKDSKVPVVCCGQPMQELVANTVDASQEKHLPVVSRNDNIVTVNVGSINHPMLQEHYIDWVYLQTKLGGQIKKLEINQEPQTSFAVIDGDEVQAVYSYCNLHGLWKV